MASNRIPEEVIEEIRQRADIVEIISEYVALEQAGQHYKGLCPFHQEKTPSFTVSPAKQIFHCYGCGVGGNVFTFLMRHEKYTFPEAVQILARRLGVQLPERAAAPQATQQLRRSDALYQLHADAARFFSQQLHAHEQGKKALDYLHRRGIQDDTIATFGLGYAPPGWESLRNILRRKYPLPLLLESGLLLKKKSGAGEYDRFRDRLIVPISDDRGRIVAFGGRILGDGVPKYLNSPETAIFHKGQVLFGAHHAQRPIRQKGYALIVEGYFDMIVPYSCGITNIVATMGTALTPHHLRQLQRYAKKVVLMFDADFAGIKAVQRTLDLFLETGFDVRAAVLPQGDDPDTAIRKMGAEQFLQYVENAPFLLDFIRNHIVQQYDLDRIEQQIECANKILPTILKIRSESERNIQIQRTAYLLRVSESALMEEFKKARKGGNVRPSTPRPASPQETKTIPLVERYLLKALLKDKSLIALVQEQLEPSELSHPVAQKVLQELCVFRDKTDFEARILDEFKSTEYQDLLAEFLIEDEEVVDPKRTVHDCVRRLKQKRFQRATLTITRKVRDAQEHKHNDLLQAFLEQKNKDLLAKKHQT